VLATRKLFSHAKLKTNNEKQDYLSKKEEKWRNNRAFTEVNYFFFGAGFFSSFLTGFLATSITSGIIICLEFVFKTC
jgi:hypothetical protein